MRPEARADLDAFGDEMSHSLMKDVRPPSRRDTHRRKALSGIEIDPALRFGAVGGLMQKPLGRLFGDTVLALEGQEDPPQAVQNIRRSVSTLLLDISTDAR